jgi:hypothetical protein
MLVKKVGEGQTPKKAKAKAKKKKLGYIFTKFGTTILLFYFSLYEKTKIVYIYAIILLVVNKEHISLLKERKKERE